VLKVLGSIPRTTKQKEERKKERKKGGKEGGRKEKEQNPE
jgi:hypothetical protein